MACATTNSTFHEFSARTAHIMMYISLSALCHCVYMCMCVYVWGFVCLLSCHLKYISGTPLVA